MEEVETVDAVLDEQFDSDGYYTGTHDDIDAQRYLIDEVKQLRKQVARLQAENYSDVRKAVQMSDDVQDKIQALMYATVLERARFVEAHKEAICEAWIAQHGFTPEECALMYQTLENGNIRVWIEKRGEFDELRSLREETQRLQAENYSLRQDLEELRRK